MKQLILIPILFLLALPLSFAAAPTTVGLVNYWSCYNDDGNDIPDQVGTNNLTKVGTWSVDTVNGICSTPAPEQTDTFFRSNETLDSSLTGTNVRTLVFWHKPLDNSEAAELLFNIGDGGSNTDWIAQISSSIHKTCNGAACAGTITVAWDEWQLFVISIDSASYVNLYINDSFSANSNWAGHNTAASQLRICDNAAESAAQCAGDFSQFALYSKNLTVAEITDWYNAGWDNDLFGDSLPPTVDATSINNTAPFQNDFVNITINFTDTGNISGYVFAWDNASGTFNNDTFVDLASLKLTKANVSVDKIILNSSNATISYKWFLNDTSGNIKESDTFTVTVAGTTAPTLILGQNNFFKADNSTTINEETGKTVLLNLSFEDDIDLFAFNITITSGGTVCYNLTNTSLSGLSDSFSGIINVSTKCSTEGFHEVNITMWDSHTVQAIDDYVFRKGRDYLEYDNAIRITAEDAISSDSTKQNDRYDFEFEYSDWFTPTTKTFYVESNGELYYRQDSKYKAHFVDWKNKKWIDFEGIDEKATVTKINDFKYRIEFNNADKKMVFSSIGGLNSQTDEFKYFLGNVALTWFIPVTTSAFFNNDTIPLSLEADGEFRNETRFRLYNSTKELIRTFNTSNIGTGSYFYNITFTGLTDDLYFVNATHIDTSGIYTNITTLTFSTASFNITFNDEILDTIITEDLITLQVIGDDFAQNFSTTTGVIGVGGWTLGDYRLTFSSPKYAIRDHYFSLDNVTNFSVTLYMLSIGNGTEVTFTVQDNSGTDLDDALIMLKRYYVSTNSYRTVAMSKTNEEGESIIDVDFNDAFYETLTTFGDFTLRTTGAKIISTTLILTMDLLTDPFTTIDAISGITTSLSFTNTTQTFVYVFTDTTGTTRTGNLDVILKEPDEDTTVCSNTDTSMSATLLCVVNTTANPGTYIAIGSITIGGEDIKTDDLQETTGFASQAKGAFGNQGVFLGIILAGTLAGLGAGVSPAVAIIMFLAGLGVVNFLGFSIWGLTLYVSFVIGGAILIFRMKR